MLDLNLLVEKHRELDFLIENSKNKKDFLSDWNCQHPFYLEYFNNSKIDSTQIQKYNYVRAEDDLTKLISAYHTKNEEPYYSLNEIIVSHGSTTIISSFFIWLKLQKIECVYYIPPVYFTFHFFSKIYNIPLRPISSSHLIENDMHFNFPKKKSILIVTDPVWYAGFSVRKSVINAIAKWQEVTKSIVFVDGSFQYFKWDLVKYEHTSMLNKANTFRLVCPTKAIATHGLRFSYLLLPENLYNTFDFILDNMMGSSNPYDIDLAKKCMTLLSSTKSNNELIKYVENIYIKFCETDIFSEVISPNCGYFVFAKLKSKSKSFHTMDGSYFEQKKYKGYVRINLLSPSVSALT
jgi:aspartate/methionine/tyrosine aminotransferase